MKFRILQYRPARDHRLLDNLIDIHSFFWNGLMHPTKLKLLYTLRSSHCEVWLPENDTGRFYYAGDDEYLSYTGTCYTSTMDGVNNGSVKRPAGDILAHPERWYYYQYDVCKEAFDYMKGWMELEVLINTGYDWHGDIPKFFLPYRTQNVEDTEKICSGFSWIALFKAACRQNLLKYDKVLFELIAKAELNDLYSPLLMSYKQYQAGAKPIVLKKG